MSRGRSPLNDRRKPNASDEELLRWEYIPWKQYNEMIFERKGRKAKGEVVENLPIPISLVRGQIVSDYEESYQRWIASRGKTPHNALEERNLRISFAKLNAAKRVDDSISRYAYGKLMEESDRKYPISNSLHRTK